MSEQDIDAIEPELPATYYVRRSTLVDWLEQWGISPKQTRQLIEAKVIPGHKFPGCRERKYVPREVVIRLKLGRQHQPAEQS